MLVTPKNGTACLTFALVTVEAAIIHLIASFYSGSVFVPFT